MLEKIVNFLNLKIFNRCLSFILITLFIVFAILKINVLWVIIGYTAFIFIKTLLTFIYNKKILKGGKK